MKLYDTVTRPISEIEEDLARAKKMTIVTVPTSQHIFYNMPYGQEYKDMVIEDFEWELTLAKLRDAAQAKENK